MRFDCGVRRELHAHAPDYALSGAMVAVAVLALVTRIDVQDLDAAHFEPDAWWGWVLSIAVCTTLIGRRRWPLRSLATGLVLVLPLEFGSQRDTVTFFVLVIALYSVAAHLPPRLAARGVVLMVAFYAVVIANGTVILSVVGPLGPLFLAAAFTLGLLIRRGRTNQQHAAQCAIDRATAAMETTELGAADERLRMAQELHDILAHSLSVIAVQAGIGVHLIDRQPLEASRALDAIRATCDTTASELDRLVGILRSGSDAGGGSVAGDCATPAPTIADILGLVEQIRGASLAVTLIIAGDPTTVPPGASLAVYRIVQEALTNVVRHAGRGAAATVTIDVGVDGVSLVVDDNGRGAAPQETGARSGGNGLLGMGERARMYGGDVQSGPRPGGGFRVRAALVLHAPVGAVGAGAEAASARNSAPPATPVADDRGRRSGHRRFSTSVWDAALAVLMGLIATLEVVTADATTDGPQFTPTHLWAFALRTASCATLAFRRRHPTIAYAVAWIIGLALTIGDYQVGVMIFVLWIGLYTIAAYSTTRHLVGAVIGTTIGIVAVAWSKPPDLTDAGAVWAWVFFAASAVAGYSVRADRDRRAAELEARSEESAAHARHARLVLTSERLRIADELGDVITRSIGVIAAHADSGAQLVSTNTGAARDALQAISAISRDALNDLRRLLKHMRTTTGRMAYSPVTTTIDRTPSAVGATT